MGGFHQRYLQGNVIIDFISYSNDLGGGNRHINFTVNIAQKAWRLRKAGKSSMVGKWMICYCTLLDRQANLDF